MKVLLYIFAFLFCFRFMGIISVPSTTIACCILLLSILNYKKGLPLNKYIIALGVCIIFNAFSCLYFNDQSLLSSFRASNDFFNLALCWFFYNWDLSLKQWEKALWWICLCFGICYIIQYLVYPSIIFSGQIRTEGPEQRMAIFGQGLASFSVLFGINKYFLTHNIKYIVIILTGLFAVFGCGYRTMLLALLVNTFILVIRLGISKRTIISFVLIIITIYFFVNEIDFIQDQITNMTNRQEVLDNNGFKNDPRYLNIIYHYTSYFKNPIEMILGSGMPFDGTKYYDFIQKLNYSCYHYSDWGLIGLSWLLGIPAVIVMVAYSINIFRTKVSKEYLYIGTYFFNIVTSSITTHEFYIDQNYVVQAILFCVFMKILKKYNLRMA